MNIAFSPIHIGLLGFTSLLAIGFGIALFKCMSSRKALEKEKCKFKGLMDTAPFTISWISSDYSYLDVNAKLASLVGIDAVDFVGKTVGFYGADLNYLIFIQSLFEYEEEQVTTEFQMTTDQGQRDLLCIGRKSEDRTQATIIGIDITDQKRAARIILEQQQKLIDSAKLTTLGEMAGSIGHEINNPLTLIVNWTDELRYIFESEKPNIDRAKEVTDKIDNTALRIAKIIKGLKTFAREGGSDPFKPELVKNIVDETLELCTQRFKHHQIKLDVVKIPEDLEIECRKTQISQVILNLLNNALDAICDLDEKWIQIYVRDANNNVEIDIIDSGSGIPLDIQNRIQEPFFTTKEMDKGTGLGLSISKGIIEEHKGSITIDNDFPNTKFVIKLPKTHKKNSKPNPENSAA